MQTRSNPARLGTCTLSFFGCLFATAAFGQTLKQVTKFDWPGPGGKRFDHFAIDEDGRYLLSALLAAGPTYALDLGTNKVTHRIQLEP